MNIAKTGEVISIRESGDKFGIAVFSDVHFDSPLCVRDALLKDIQEAYQRGYYIVLLGDLFDVMNGRFDPRRDYTGIRKEYIDAIVKEGKSYFNVVVEDAVRFFKPFSDKILVAAQGNHELSVSRNSDFNLQSAFISMIGHGVVGDYAGYVVLTLEPRKKVAPKYTIYYHHGFGAGARKSYGVLDTNILAMEHPDADLIILGHNHNSWQVEVPRQRVSDAGNLYQDYITFVRVPSYKKSDTTGNSWEVTRNLGPKVVGWVTLDFNVVRVGGTDRIKCAVARHVSSV